MDYLKCVQEDIKAVNLELIRLKQEYEKKITEAQKKITDLEAEENKIMKRTSGMNRCPNCRKFVQPNGYSDNPHAHDTEYATDYSCTPERS
jgi:hypothetical protein